MRTIGGAAIGVVVGVLVIFELATWQGLGGHARMYLRDVVTLIGPLVAIVLILGFWAWRDVFVSALVTAVALPSALVVGYIAFIAYLLAITPPAPPGVIDWTYGYSEDEIHIAIVLGLGVAAGILAVGAVLFRRLRPSSERR